MITTDGTQLDEVITPADTASVLSQDGGSGVDGGNQTSAASSEPQRSRPTINVVTATMAATDSFQDDNDGPP